MKRALVAAALVAALSAAGLAWRMNAATPAPVATVQPQPLVRSLQFSARVATVSRVDLGATVTGRVQAVAVTEGATVRAGQPLIRLEADELGAALAQAQASERQAAARLAGLRSTGRRGSVAGTAQAESVLAAAQADLARTEALVAQGFLSAARLDEGRRAVAVARAQMDAARAQEAAVAEQGSDVAQAQAQLALAQAATRAAQARLAQAVVLAPADGRVLARLVEPGQIVQPGKALLSLALAGPVQLKAQVDERYLEQLQPGQAARVVADAFPAQPFNAQVLSLAPLVDAQRGAIEVKLAPQPPVPAFLREDMTLSVDVETARRARALALPAAALRSEPQAGRSRVLVVRDGRVEERVVRIGLATLDAVEVLEGLAEGEQVLTGPALAPGQRVRAQPQAAAPGRPAGGESAGSALTGAMGR